MKNVTLIGASEFVGTAILNELLARGHKVTAVVRNPEKVSVSSPNLVFRSVEQPKTIRNIQA